jgi:hypothetical protein
MATFREIHDALDAVEDAETALEEVTALVRLDRLVKAAAAASVTHALTIHPVTEVARACGISRQALSKRHPRGLAA